MRSRYWVTSSRDVTRPSFIAACISGIVASTTLKGRRLAGILGPRVRVCPHKVVVADNRNTTDNASFIVADSIPIKHESHGYLRGHERDEPFQNSTERHLRLSTVTADTDVSRSHPTLLFPAKQRFTSCGTVLRDSLIGLWPSADAG